MNASEIIAHNGSMEKQSNTTHVVNLWYIPRGTDYDDAIMMNAFFSKETDADAFANKYAMPPEMAFTMTIAQHDSIRAKIAKN